jgi:DUF971 family protein
MSPTPWPTEIRLKKSANALVVTFDDGVACTLAGKLLRENSPSAQTQGHGGAKPDIVIDPAVRVTGVDLIGNYAVRLTFSDGHDSGFYTWDKLRELGAAR